METEPRKWNDYGIVVVAAALMVALVATHPTARLFFSPTLPARNCLHGISCVDLEENPTACAVTLKNRTVIIFSVFCPSCRKVMSELPWDTGWVGISSNSIPFLRYHRVKLGTSLPIYRVERKLLEEIGVSRLPALIRVDNGGRIVSRVIGEEPILSAVEQLRENHSDD